MNIVSLESIITEPLVVNAVRIFIDEKQAIFYPQGKHPVDLQVVIIGSSSYDYKTKRFVYHRATDEEIADFLKRKVYWLGFRRGNQATSVCVADPYDAVYLGVSTERLQQASAILAAEGFVHIDSSGFYANAGTKLLQKARGLDSERALFFSTDLAQPKPVPVRLKTVAPDGSALFDVFISHATEDNNYVEPLVKALEAAGIRVWFDKSALEWGDDLRSSIDRGLANCRYGIVIFSKAFLGKKKWTEYELNSLFALEKLGRKVVLPIWHGITRYDFIQYSPAFADRLAKISSTDSYGNIVESLLAMLGRSKPQECDVANMTRDVGEVTLEAFYVNHDPHKHTFACQSVSELPGKYIDDTSADGRVMRSEIEPPSVVIKGIDVKAVESLGWQPTRLLFQDARTGESKEFSGQLRDSLEPNTLKFAIHD